MQAALLQRRQLVGRRHDERRRRQQRDERGRVVRGPLDGGEQQEGQRRRREPAREIAADEHPAAAQLARLRAGTARDRAQVKPCHRQQHRQHRGGHHRQPHDAEGRQAHAHGGAHRVHPVAGVEHERPPGERGEQHRRGEHGSAHL